MLFWKPMEVLQDTVVGVTWRLRYFLESKLISNYKNHYFGCIIMILKIKNIITCRKYLRLRNTATLSNSVLREMVLKHKKRVLNLKYISLFLRTQFNFSLVLQLRRKEFQWHFGIWIHPNIKAFSFLWLAPARRRVVGPWIGESVELPHNSRSQKYT